MGFLGVYWRMLCPQCKTIVQDGAGRCDSCGCAITGSGSGIGGLLSEHPILSVIGLIGCGMMLMYLLPSSKPPEQPAPPPPAPTAQVIEDDQPAEDDESADDEVASEEESSAAESAESAAARRGNPIVFVDNYYPEGMEPDGRYMMLKNLEMYRAAHEINQSDLSNDNFKNMVASFGFFIVMGVTITIIRRKLNS
jgi:hypothetical protein